MESLEGYLYRDKHYFAGQGVMAPTRSGTSAKQNPRGVNPEMAAGREGPLSQTSNIIICYCGSNLVVKKQEKF